MTKTAWKFCKR